MRKGKLMLIGWDAADWKVINPLLDAGMMPNLARLVNQGTIGNLATMDPAYSPMLWTSIATGKHSYKHGIHGFLETTKDGKSVKPVLSTSRKVKAIWEILSEQDYKTHVVGWWPSHPAEPMNGISISNFYQKASNNSNNRNEVMEGCIHPAKDHERFQNLKINAQELTGQHILPFIPLADKIDQSKEKGVFTVADETAQAASIQAAFTNIVRNEEWDFAAVYFDTIDHYCHGFMKYHPPKQDHIPQYGFDLYKDVVTAGYRFHDMMLGTLLDLIDEDTTVMLISDHGFQPDHLRPKELPHEPGGPAYEHSPYGVIAMMGPDIKKDHIIHGSTLLDICPTILALYDQAVGEDMDGKVLVDAFVENKEVQYIESWEDVEFTKFKRQSDYTLGSDDEDALMNQLIALGYVEPMKEDKNENVRSNKNFNQFNLAKSYMFAGLMDEAIVELEDLVQKNPNTPRFKFQLATCYQSKGMLEKTRALVATLNEKKYYNPKALQIMEATLLIGEKQYKKALVVLEQLEQESVSLQAEVYAKLAKCYMKLGNLTKAQKALDKGKSADYDNAQIHFLEGLLTFHKENFENAIEAFLTSIGLEYNNTRAHRYLGAALYKTGRYKEAASALEVSLKMFPENNMSRSTLIDIYKIHLDDVVKASEHRQAMHQHIKGEVIVVSGLPRSGTSMMMQMLDSAGFDIYTDKVRTADQNNLKGYYEHENVKTLFSNKMWMKECDGKVVKIISNLLPAVPLSNKYKIIMMERDLNEILASQTRMVKLLGKKVAEDTYPLEMVEKLEQSVKVAMEWAQKQPGVELLLVNYKDVISDPFGQALRVSEFLGKSVEPEKMIGSIDPKLYREKSMLSSISN